MSIDSLWYDGRARRVETIKGIAGAPLVVCLPPYTATIDRMKTMMSPEKFAPWNVVVPEALPRLIPRWNDSPYPQLQTNVDDVGFINSVIRTALTVTKANPARVFLVGFSNGGFMNFRLQHESVGLRVRALVCVSAALPTAFKTGPKWICYPRSTLMMNGTEDTNCHYNGELGVLSAPETAQYWKDKLVPNGAYTSTDLPNTTNDGVVATSEKWVGDAGKVEFITLTGGGHYWPGGRNMPIIDPTTGKQVGKIPTGFDATLYAKEWLSTL